MMISKEFLTVFMIGYSFVAAFGQKTTSIGSEQKKTVAQSLTAKVTAKEELKKAVLKSQQSKNVSIKIDLIVQNKQIVSIFEYSAPNRYYLFETNSGVLLKEAIEIAGQRFQRKNEQWTKTRKDYYPLREQFESYFPIKFVSKKDDVIKIRDVKVTFLGEDASADGKKYFKYNYAIFYKDFNTVESGIAWINQKSRLLEKLETENCGLFGANKAVWNYYYDKEIKIEQPKDYIEKDWIN